MKKDNRSGKQNINHKVNAQSTIVKRYLNDIFKLKKLIFVKNVGAHFTLLINQRFGTYA